MTSLSEADTTRIQDRIDRNRVIANVHPLLASKVLELAQDDKCRVQYVNDYTAIVWNSGDIFRSPRREALAHG